MSFAQEPPSQFVDQLQRMGTDAWKAEHWNWDGSLRSDIRRCWMCGGPARITETEPPVHRAGAVTLKTVACPVCTFTTTIT